MYVHEVIPMIEGMVGTMTAGSLKNVTTRVTAWAEECKHILRMPQHRGLSDWGFKCMADVDESGDVIEAGGVLYAALAGYVDGNKALCVVFVDDADGALTVTGATDVLGTYGAQITCPICATDGTEEFTGITIPGGMSATNSLMVGADTTDSTTVATNDCRVFVLYRTTAGLVA